MAWGKQDAKEVLGMEPEEFQSKLGKLDTVDQRFEALEKSQKEATDRILAQFESLKPKAPPTPAADPDLTFLEKPTESLNEALDPIRNSNLETRIMLEHRNARDRWPKEFERWGQEIISVMDNAAPAQRTNPQSWEMAVMIVRGRHAADIEKDGAQDNFNYLEPVSAGIRPDPKNNDNLTQAQRLMVNKLRMVGPEEMTPEKYKRGQQRLDKARSARLGSFAGVSNG